MYDLTLLYAEDDLEIREEVKDIFQDTFQTVYMASNGAEALKLYKTKKIDLIITDLSMPVMDGIEFIKEVRKEDNDIPVIITSAHNNSDFLLRSIELKIDGYIVKPVDFDQLMETIKKVSKNILNKKELEQTYLKLIKTQESLEKANRTKSEFLANMSHEIRTPLNAIVGFIDILKEESKGRKAFEYVDIIDKSSNSLLQIIEDILDFSKIESGKLNIEKIFFNTIEEFEHIIDLFSSKGSQKNISLNLFLDTSLPPSIKTDPLRLRQVVSNLMSNAIKFTDINKNIFIDVKFLDQQLFVSVKDEGKGIAEDKLVHIFEAFNQEDNSTTREYGGTGLGLSISKKLIKLLGGDLRVKSELGKGSEFYFSIPVDIGKSLIEKDIVNSNTRLDGHILLVEDNHANQLFMKVVLKKLGLSFDIANDGLEAVKMFQSHNYNAILMDENMPNMNGIEASIKILQYEKENNLPHTPIIALTANALKGDRERFLSVGMDEYLTKPIDKNRLANILYKLL